MTITTKELLAQRNALTDAVAEGHRREDELRAALESESKARAAAEAERDEAKAAEQRAFDKAIEVAGRTAHPFIKAAASAACDHSDAAFGSWGGLAQVNGEYYEVTIERQARRIERDKAAEHSQRMTSATIKEYATKVEALQARATAAEAELATERAARERAERELHVAWGDCEDATCMACPKCCDALRTRAEREVYRAQATAHDALTDYRTATARAEQAEARCGDLIVQAAEEREGRLKAEAAAAVMREVLQDVAWHNHGKPVPSTTAYTFVAHPMPDVARIDAALATDAGAALLARLHKAEAALQSPRSDEPCSVCKAEREALRAEVGRLRGFLRRCYGGEMPFVSASATTDGSRDGPWTCECGAFDEQDYHLIAHAPACAWHEVMLALSGTAPAEGTGPAKGGACASSPNFPGVSIEHRFKDGVCEWCGGAE